MARSGWRREGGRRVRGVGGGAGAGGIAALCRGAVTKTGAAEASPHRDDARIGTSIPQSATLDPSKQGAPLEAGTRIGSYEIIAPIDAGGMGVVYRALHTGIGREVAIKVLLPNLMLSEKVRDRFKQEAYVQAQLDHPNIVRVSDAVQETEHYAIVMELIDGGSLSNKLDATPGAWSEADFRTLFDPIVDGVAYAHGRGIVHRDIKPGNILLTKDGIPKVTDFGIAKILAADSGMTRTGTKMGTAPYMAPEQFEGQKDLGTPADVYALGMLAWRMLTGDLPVDPENIKAIFSYYMGAETLPSIQEAIPGLSPGLARIIDGCLALDPKQRPKDAGVLQKLLAATAVTDIAEQPSPIETTEPEIGISAPLSEYEKAEFGHQDTVFAEPPSEKNGTPRNKILIIAVGLIAVVLFGAYLLQNDKKERKRPRDDATSQQEGDAPKATDNSLALNEKCVPPAGKDLAGKWYINSVLTTPSRSQGINGYYVLDLERNGCDYMGTLTKTGFGSGKNKHFPEYKFQIGKVQFGAKEYGPVYGGNAQVDLKRSDGSARLSMHIAIYASSGGLNGYWRYTGESYRENPWDGLLKGTRQSGYPKLSLSETHPPFVQCVWKDLSEHHGNVVAWSKLEEECTSKSEPYKVQPEDQPEGKELAASSISAAGGPHLGEWVMDIDSLLSMPESANMPPEQREMMKSMMGSMSFKFTEDTFIMNAMGKTQEMAYSITKKDGNKMTILMDSKDGGGGEAEMVVEGDTLTMTKPGQKQPMVLKRK